MATARDFSKHDQTVVSPTWDHVQIGCLQRIADATEAMAKSYADLIKERDRYLRWYREEAADKVRLHRQCAALRGHITRLKRKK